MATAKFYGKFLANQLDGSAVVDFDTDGAADDIKVALTTSSYTPNQDSHEFFDDVTNELSTGDGYTAGGEPLAGCDISYDASSNEVRFAFTDPTWTSATFTARNAIIYKDTGTASTSPLIAYVTFDDNVSVTSGTLTLDFADPPLKITVS